MIAAVSKPVSRAHKIRILTNSERSTAACQKRWRFAYLDGLTGGSTPAPLIQGSLWHRCLEVFYREGMRDDLATLDAAVIGPWLAGRAESEYCDPESDLEIAREVRGMLQGYLDLYGDRDRAAWEVIAVEGQVARRLPNQKRPERGFTDFRQDPRTGLSQSRAWYYGAGLDLIVRNATSGELWLVEHKTTGASDLDQYLRKLHLDPQIRGYAWALLDPDRDLSDPAIVAAVIKGTGVRGIIYNVARKSVPRWPERIKSGTLSRAAIDTTWERYLEAIEAHGLNELDYTDMRDKLVGKAFFARETYLLTGAELEDWRRDMSTWGAEISRLETLPHHPRQLGVCQMHGASRCQYASICLEDGPQARANFGIKTVRHVELTGDLSEPWVGAARNRPKQASGHAPEGDLWGSDSQSVGTLDLSGGLTAPDEDPLADLRD